MYMYIANGSCTCTRAYLGERGCTGDWFVSSGELPEAGSVSDESPCSHPEKEEEKEVRWRRRRKRRGEEVGSTHMCTSMHTSMYM